jgi:hypothetical protein
MTKDFFQLQNNIHNKRTNIINPYQPIKKLSGFIDGKRFFYSQKRPRTFRTHFFNASSETSTKRNKNKKRMRHTKKKQVKIMRQIKRENPKSE